ncbi:MAG: NAD(P)H:quinone oxidoreductase [Actinomycetota bacterium]
MESVKVAIIYYSATGTLHAMAQQLERSAQQAGAKVRVRHATELAPPEVIKSNAQWQQHREVAASIQAPEPDDVTWADAVLFGSPTRFGAVASQLKQFFDSLGQQWSRGELANKVYSGFTASQTTHGGQESTLLNLYTMIYHFGGLIVPPGYTDPLKFADGNPYGVSHVTGPENDAPLGEAEINALNHLAVRVIDMAQRLTKPQSEASKP